MGLFIDINKRWKAVLINKEQISDLLRNNIMIYDLISLLSEGTPLGIDVGFFDGPFVGRSDGTLVNIMIDMRNELFSVVSEILI